MKLAFVYAGQGSQFAGMGKDIYEEYPAAREVYDSARLDFDLKTTCFEDPQGLLSQTQYTQPCMVATAIAITKVLREAGIEPDVAAGLSLGEYSALYCAGVLGEEQVLDLIAFRGRAMQKASEGIDCAMTAILGLNRELVQQACEKASEHGLVQPANYNCPGQIVIGGQSEAVDAAAQIALNLGAKRAIRLAVSGPFHTALMQDAADALHEHFTGTDFAEMRIPVVFNAVGRTISQGESIAKLLEQQVKSPVYFEDSILHMIEMGVDTVVEIGPGKVLSGFIKKISKDITLCQAEDVQSIKSTIEKLKGE